MNWNIKDFGDSIEQQAATRLDLAIVKKYNALWGKYIGNVDGAPADIVGISTELDDMRLIIGQWNYTLLQNLVFLSTIGAKIPSNIKKDSKKIAESFMLYNQSVHTLYNSIEIVEDWNLSYGKNNQIDLSSFIAFRKYRNAIAHSIRPTIKIEQDLHVTDDFNRYLDYSEGDLLIWKHEKTININYITLRKFVNNCMEKAKQLLFDYVEVALKFLDNSLGNKTIGIPKATDARFSFNGYYPTTSGSTQDLI